MLSTSLAKPADFPAGEAPPVLAALTAQSLRMPTYPLCITSEEQLHVSMHAHSHQLPWSGQHYCPALQELLPLSRPQRSVGSPPQPCSS